MAEENGSKPPVAANVVRFPQSRVSPRAASRGYNDLGLSNLARYLGAPGRQGTGHWCSRCNGIWFGYVLEVTCPKCGGRPADSAEYSTKIENVLCTANKLCRRSSRFGETATLINHYQPR